MNGLNRHVMYTFGEEINNFHGKIEILNFYRSEFTFLTILQKNDNISFWNPFVIILQKQKQMFILRAFGDWLNLR